jgi:Lon-like protease
LVLALLAGALFLIPIPYIIFGPGAAVNLNSAITVPGHAPPPGRFYLTDVDLLPGRPAFWVAAKLLPGFEIIRRRELVPPSMSDRDLNTSLVDAMRESQTNAQIVAERAAGLPVRATSYFIVIRTLPHSPAEHCFSRGDKISRVQGRQLRDAGELAAVTTAQPPGTSFALTLVRNGRNKLVTCTTFQYKGKARFGVTGAFQTEAYWLPVHVHYRLPNINGSSAGLMFALQIYRTITGRDIASGRDVAGTGVLAADGSVQPIEGAREKVRAAIKARADIFFVPRENYKDIAQTKGIQVIPVKSFHDALEALQNSH